MTGKFSSMKSRSRTLLLGIVIAGIAAASIAVGIGATRTTQQSVATQNETFMTAYDSIFSKAPYRADQIGNDPVLNALSPDTIVNRLSFASDIETLKETVARLTGLTLPSGPCLVIFTSVKLTMNVATNLLSASETGTITKAAIYMSQWTGGFFDAASLDMAKVNAITTLEVFTI